MFWVCKLYQGADMIITWANWSLQLNGRIMWTFCVCDTILMVVFVIYWWATETGHYLVHFWRVLSELLWHPCRKCHAGKQIKKLRSVILISLVKSKRKLITELLDQERVRVISHYTQFPAITTSWSITSAPDCFITFYDVIATSRFGFRQQGSRFIWRCELGFGKMIFKIT